MFRLAPLCLLLITLPAQAQLDEEGPHLLRGARIVGGLDTIRAELRYPDKAQNDRIEGDVRIRVTVLENRQGAEVSVQQSAGPVLDAEALRAVRQAQFEPALWKDGGPAKIDLIIPVRFALDSTDVWLEHSGDHIVVWPTGAEVVYTITDRPPELIGGFDSLQSKVRYPEDARQRGAEGTVFVRFAVGKSGNVLHPVCVRAPSNSLCTEAIRVIRASAFNPGYEAGQAVITRFVLPVRFRLR